MADHPQEEMVWIGDMSGFSMAPTIDDAILALTHRCGWSQEVPPAENFLGNITMMLLDHRRTGCNRG